MGVLFFIVLGIIFFYYQNQNKQIDPRVASARKMYERYDQYISQQQFTDVLQLLDSIESVYDAIPHYAASFEKGVIYNNRAAVYLSMAIAPGNFTNNQKQDSALIDSLFRESIRNANKSIAIYTRWNQQFKDRDIREIKTQIRDTFLLDLPQKNLPVEKYLDKRVEEIMDATYENKRRLSVAHTNLGVALRHLEEYERAMKHYQKALELWDRNLAAENNINILLGKPLRKRGILEKLFPPEKSRD